MDQPTSALVEQRNVGPSAAVPYLRDGHLDRRSSHGTVVGFPLEGFRSPA